VNTKNTYNDIENWPIAVITFDQNGVILFASKHAKKLFKFTRPEGKLIFEFVNETQKRTANERLRKIVEGIELDSHIYQLERGDDTYFWGEIKSYYDHKAENGILIINDITDEIEKGNIEKHILYDVTEIYDFILNNENQKEIITKIVNYFMNVDDIDSCAFFIVTEDKIKYLDGINFPDDYINHKQFQKGSAYWDYVHHGDQLCFNHKNYTKLVNTDITALCINPIVVNNEIKMLFGFISLSVSEFSKAIIVCADMISKKLSDKLSFQKLEDKFYDYVLRRLRKQQKKLIISIGEKKPKNEIAKELKYKNARCNKSHILSEEKP